MKCKDAKQIYAGLIKKQNKALHRAEWLPNEIDRLQGLLNGVDIEADTKNYNQILRLSEEIKSNGLEMVKIKSDIAKMTSEYGFLSK